MCGAEQSKALVYANISKTEPLIYKTKILAHASKPTLIFNNIIFSLMLCPQSTIVKFDIYIKIDFKAQK